MTTTRDQFSADNAGAKIVEEAKRTYLRRAASLYVQDAENRNDNEAAEQAELVTTEFMDVCRKTFVDEVAREDIFRFHKALRDRGCSDRTVANKHARLKSLRFQPTPSRREPLHDCANVQVSVRYANQTIDAFAHWVQSLGA